MSHSGILFAGNADLAPIKNSQSVMQLWTNRSR
jgi:hypothetical protein